MNLYDMFKANQRIEFVFDMENLDETGEDFVIEEDSIDKSDGKSEKDINKSDHNTSEKRKE